MRSRLARIAGTFLVAAGLGLVAAAVVVAPAGAAEAPVGLGTASSFAVLAGTTVTNTGSSVITGNVGVSPGTAITGFPPGTVNGTFHRNDAAAIQAQSDVTIAYNDAAGRAPTQSGMANLTGMTLVSGVYSGAAGLSLNGSGVLTLNGQGDPNAVFIFQAGSTFISGSSSVVRLTNSAQACNVYWKVGSSATLGTNSVLVGTVLALTSVTANTG
ncbi:MAG: ice-binding family protein, partial [Acidimicrobiales bacterium]